MYFRLKKSSSLASIIWKDIFKRLKVLGIKKKSKPSIPDKSTPFVEPSYFKELGIVWTNDNVGQTFVNYTKRQPIKTQDS